MGNMQKVSPSNMVFFDFGSAYLNEEGIRVIDKFASGYNSPAGYSGQIQIGWEICKKCLPQIWCFSILDQLISMKKVYALLINLLPVITHQQDIQAKFRSDGKYAKSVSLKYGVFRFWISLSQ